MLSLAYSREFMTPSLPCLIYGNLTCGITYPLRLRGFLKDRKRQNVCRPSQTIYIHYKPRISKRA